MHDALVNALQTMSCNSHSLQPAARPVVISFRAWRLQGGGKASGNATASFACLAAAQVHLLALKWQRCCRRDLQQLAAKVEALRGQMGDSANRYSEGLAGSDDSTQSADAAGHSRPEADAQDEPGAGPDARALARRLAALEGALGDLAAAQERAHRQVSAGLACVTQQLDSLQVRHLAEAPVCHAAQHKSGTL